MKTICLFAVLIVLSGCGFKLKGAYTFPFTSAVLDSPAAAPEFGLTLRRAIEAEGSVRLLSADAAKALTATAPTAHTFVRIRVLEVLIDKKILSLSSGGKVREFQLEQRVKFDVVDAFNNVILQPRQLTTTREYSFSDAQALAKEGEERMLREDMQADLIAQIMRQLQAARKS